MKVENADSLDSKADTAAGDELFMKDKPKRVLHNVYNSLAAKDAAIMKKPFKVPKTNKTATELVPTVNATNNSIIAAFERSKPAAMDISINRKSMEVFMLSDSPSMPIANLDTSVAFANPSPKLHFIEAATQPVENCPNSVLTPGILTVHKGFFSFSDTEEELEE